MYITLITSLPSINKTLHLTDTQTTDKEFKHVIKQLKENSYKNIRVARSK